MTQITSYKQAEAIFAKVRNPAMGKPLEHRGWRMFKDGDEFVINCGGAQVARILPNNTLRISLSEHRVPNPVPYNVHNVLPITTTRRATGHYRVHIEPEGTNYSHLSPQRYGLANWNELRTGGVRLYEGLVIDLTTRTVVGAKEIVTVVDADARKEWLRASKKVKTYLKTIVKLGGFTARTEALKAAGKVRWEYGTLHSAGQEDIDLIVAVLRGGDTEPLVQRVAESLYRHFYSSPETAKQIAHIDSIFTSNSLALRTTLGVVDFTKE